MAFKKIRVAFDLPMETLLAMLQHGASDMRVEIVGDTPPPQPTEKRVYVKKDKPKLLSSPPEEGRLTLMAFLKVIFNEAGERVVTLKELKPRVIAYGFAAKSISPQVSDLEKAGLVKKTGVNPGEYLATKKLLEDSAHG